MGGEKCSLRLTILSGAGPLVVSPCLETTEATGAFSLNVFSDIPLERVEELRPSSHKVFVGRWEESTAGGSLNFPSQLAMGEAQKRAVECSEEIRKQGLSLGALEGGPRSSRSSKQLPGRWVSNPLYLVVAGEPPEETPEETPGETPEETPEETARMEGMGSRVCSLRLAGKPQGGGLRAEGIGNDMAGCMMALYVFKGRTVNTGALVAQTNFEVGNEVSLSVSFSRAADGSAAEYLIMPATWRYLFTHSLTIAAAAAAFAAAVDALSAAGVAAAAAVAFAFAAAAALAAASAAAAFAAAVAAASESLVLVLLLLLLLHLEEGIRSSSSRQQQQQQQQQRDASPPAAAAAAEDEVQEAGGATISSSSSSSSSKA
ncbi:hypothetical protein ACSSS7_006579 [Eimeria intestinalis]